jgi:hypothetical protein
VPPTASGTGRQKPISPRDAHRSQPLSSARGTGPQLSRDSQLLASAHSRVRDSAGTLSPSSSDLAGTRLPTRQVMIFSCAENRSVAGCADPTGTLASRLGTQPCPRLRRAPQPIISLPARSMIQQESGPSSHLSARLRLPARLVTQQGLSVPHLSSQPDSRRSSDPRSLAPRLSRDSQSLISALSPTRGAAVTFSHSSRLPARLATQQGLSVPHLSSQPDSRRSSDPQSLVSAPSPARDSAGTLSPSPQLSARLAPPQ